MLMFSEIRKKSTRDKQTHKMLTKCSLTHFIPCIWQAISLQEDGTGKLQKKCKREGFELDKGGAEGFSHVKIMSV